jgi:hypothetical protein
MELKYLEWNLHAQGGRDYNIPGFVPEYLKQVDLFVLVEFKIAKGWSDFTEELESDFDLYCSPYATQEYNQVCIGLRKTAFGEPNAIITADNMCNGNIPEYLRVDIPLQGKNLSIIGTRIKTQSGTKNEQYAWLKEQLSGIERYICLGDFNCVSTVLSQTFDGEAVVYGPRISNNYYSYVFEDGESRFRGLDWALIKGANRVYNGYGDSVDSPYATYDWSFVNQENGYGDKTERDYLNIRGLPDHAILKGMIKL